MNHLGQCLIISVFILTMICHVNSKQMQAKYVIFNKKATALNYKFLLAVQVYFWVSHSVSYA